jgi:hypothetical protein
MEGTMPSYPEHTERIKRTPLKRKCRLFPGMLVVIMMVLLAAGVPQLSAADLTPAWTGDLDGMVERRSIRTLVPYNNTHFFLDRGRMHGATYE